MKQFAPVLAGVLCVSSLVACGKSPEAQNQAKLPAQTQVVPAGTTFEVSLPKEVSTAKNRDQDPLTLPVKSPLIGANPVLKGAKVEAHLEDVVKAERGKKARLHLVFDEIVLKDGSTQPLNATLVNSKVETKTQGKFIKNVGIVLGGTAAGHFAGKKMGQKHGGLAGAAAATAFVLASPGGDVVLKKGSVLELKLKTPIEPAKVGV
ncbi:MAG TPA: hypothetical protein V6D19_23020 [Stenomitos sp.]